MFVADFMTSTPQTVREQDRLVSAFDRLRRGGFHQLPVVDESDRLVGIISDRDVRSASGYDGKLGGELSVSEVMTSSPKTIHLDATLDEALQILSAGRFNAVPVMNSGRLVGIITRRDLLRAFQEILGLDRGGRRVEIALPDIREDLAAAFTALKSSDCDITSAVVSSMRNDGDEPTLYLRVDPEHARSVERAMRNAGLIVLVPQHC